jgi:hypothetical protein
MNADEHRSEFRSVFIRVHLWLDLFREGLL